MVEDEQQAMEDPPHPATIHDLPLHILHDIFQHFQDPRIEPKGQIDFGTYVSEDNRNTLCNARLVCHLFNDVASAFLFSIVRVELNQKSLDQLVQFSQSPQLAQHVRGIEVWLDYRPAELSTDMAAFSDNRKSVVEHLHGPCYACDGDPDIEGLPWPWTDGPLPPDCQLLNAIYACWDEACGVSQDNMDEACGVSEDNTIPKDDPLMKEYQEVLREAFDLYCQAHEEQLGLIISGSFVQTVSSCVSRMPNAHALALLDDKVRGYLESGRKELIRDQVSLVRILQRPLSWKKIEHIQRFSEDSESDLNYEFPPAPEVMILPARILTELPIALHDSGTTLRDLYVGSFPYRGHFHAICAPNTDDPLVSTIWTDLQAACQQLRSVSFGHRHEGRDIRLNHLTDTESMYVNQFVGAILYSRELEVVYLSFSMLGLNKNIGRVCRRIGAFEYDMTSSISTVRSPLIRSLIFHSATVGCSELTALCAGLGSSLETLRIWSVNLRDGSWASILDNLRSKAKRSCRFNGSMLCISSLTGGEFEAYSPPPPRNDYELSIDWEGSKWQPQARLINELAKKYVSGVEDMQNPFSTSSHIIAQEKYERLLKSRG